MTGTVIAAVESVTGNTSAETVEHLSAATCQGAGLSGEKKLSLDLAKVGGKIHTHHDFQNGVPKFRVYAKA